MKATVSQVEASESGPPANFRPLARACIRLLKVRAAVTSATGKLRAELPVPTKPDRDAAAEDIALAEVRSGQTAPVRSGPVRYCTLLGRNLPVNLGA